jgi:hypothetical protein
MRDEIKVNGKKRSRIKINIKIWDPEKVESPESRRGRAATFSRVAPAGR